MNAKLLVLNDLSSIFESLAQDYTGEAKGGLSSLIDSLESNPAYAIPTRLQLVTDCREAVDLIRGNQKDRAAFRLMLRSRELWREVLGCQ